MSIYAKDRGSQADQGDVVEGVYFPLLDASSMAVMVTPTCDIGNEKTSALHFAACLPAAANLDRFKKYVEWIERAKKHFEEKKDNLLSKTLTKDAAKFWKRIIQNDGDFPRYYFLPQSDAHPDCLVDFSCIASVHPSKREKLVVLATLESSHRAKMIAAFAAYFSRVGVDPLPTTEERAIISRFVHPMVLLAESEP